MLVSIVCFGIDPVPLKKASLKSDFKHKSWVILFDSLKGKETSANLRLSSLNGNRRLLPNYGSTALH